MSRSYSPPPTVLVVAGTRPEWQKLASVISLLRARGVATEFLWTGQHSDLGMTTGFAEGLGWPEPDARLQWSGGGEAPATEWWREAHGPGSAPAMVLVQGDTASSLLGALMARHWKRALLCHLEAGLRSWEDDLPEEKVRRAIDRQADVLLCPSRLATAHARVDCKPWAAVYATGQTGLDALHGARGRSIPYARAGTWILLTVHRAAMDDPDALGDFLEGAVRARQRVRAQRIILPLHPRVQNNRATAQVVRDFETNSLAGLEVVPPLSYRAMVGRLTSPNRPLAVISDSGGLVEESCYLGIPTAIVRPATERWELVASGHAALVRPEDAESYLDVTVERLVRGPHRTPGSPYGNPAAATVQTPTGRAVTAICEALGPALGVQP